MRADGESPTPGAGQLQTVDLFLNFPVADINRNVLWRDPDRVDAADIARMNRFWGDDSWRQIAYSTTSNLFGWEEKTDNDTVGVAKKVSLGQKRPWSMAREKGRERTFGDAAQLEGKFSSCSSFCSAPQFS